MTMHMPELPKLDFDEELDDAKVRRAAEISALRGKIMNGHWQAICDAINGICTGEVPEEDKEEFAPQLIKFLEHTIGEQAEQYWASAQMSYAFANWANQAPDSKEKNRRRMFAHLTILQSNAKVSKAESMDDIRKIVADWDYSEEFKDLDAWAWEEAEKPEPVSETIEVPQTVREAIAKQLGVPPEEIAATADTNHPRVATVYKGSDGKLHVKELSDEEITEVSGMSKEEFTKAYIHDQDTREIDIQVDPETGEAKLHERDPLLDKLIEGFGEKE